MDNDVDIDDNENDNDIPNDSKNDLEKDLSEIIENEVEDRKDIMVEEARIAGTIDDDGFGDVPIESELLTFIMLNCDFYCK